ncbi:MAG: hypothetical protein ACJ789_02635 [Thermomicrobiales bacterium]
MPDQNLIDGLIATYRELNMRVRQLPEDKLQQRTAESASVREIVLRLRDDELRFSQALKERITGVPMPDIFGEDMPVLGTENPDDTTANMIAQFGTARESTLAMLQSVGDEEWDAAPDGAKSIRTRIQELVANDRRQLERIDGLIKAA